MTNSAKQMAAVLVILLFRTDKAGIADDAVSVVVPDATVYRSVRRTD